ncbi:MAG: hypothetical protein U0996_01795 [Planctomycetaceae bacterium]
MMSESMSPHVVVCTAEQKTVSELLSAIETMIAEAQDATRPLEVEPYRSQLFSAFASAESAGLIPRESETAAYDDLEEHDPSLKLNADTLCRLLARRWGLDMAAREAQAMQTRLPADQLERMRLLWSVMRMWMEWSYAWQRWTEFHSTYSASSGETAEQG